MSITRLVYRNSYWYVRREQTDGVPARQKSSGTTDEARAHHYLAEYLDADNAGQLWPDPATETPLPGWRVDIALGGYATAFFSPECWRRYTARTWKLMDGVIDSLSQCFYGMAMSDITKANVQAWLATRRKQVSPSTVNRDFSLLKAIFKHALQAGYIEFDPTVGIQAYREPPGRKPHLSKQQERDLLAVSSPWLRDVICCAIYTGCRLVELQRLVWGDVDLKLDTISVRESKNGTPRDIPIHSTLRPILIRMYTDLDTLMYGGSYSRRRPYPTERVLTSLGRRPLSVTGTSHAMQRAARKIGLEDLRFHDLQHIFASRMLATGATLVEVADLLGHRSLTIARRHTHSDLTRLRALMGSWKKDPENPFRKIPVPSERFDVMEISRK